MTGSASVVLVAIALVAIVSLFMIYSWAARRRRRYLRDVRANQRAAQELAQRLGTVPK